MFTILLVALKRQNATDLNGDQRVQAWECFTFFIDSICNFFWRYEIVITKFVIISDSHFVLKTILRQHYLCIKLQCDCLIVSWTCTPKIVWFSHTSCFFANIEKKLNISNIHNRTKRYMLIQAVLWILKCWTLLPQPYKRKQVQ